MRRNGRRHRWSAFSPPRPGSERRPAYRLILQPSERTRPALRRLSGGALATPLPAKRWRAGGLKLSLYRSGASRPGGTGPHRRRGSNTPSPPPLRADAVLPCSGPYLRPASRRALAGCSPGPGPPSRRAGKAPLLRSRARGTHRNRGGIAMTTVRDIHGRPVETLAPGVHENGLGQRRAAAGQPDEARDRTRPGGPGPASRTCPRRQQTGARSCIVTHHPAVFPACPRI